ncbi:chitin-binding protein [Actinomadura spongiicola]|uniref:Chitin-binding protein n=1 Tax=Actinomadura spongiicola TaxID=2303421 RepID=A0A372G882_9ACTN|nr:lytic polysaccharide monooxygenase auxiliary activity family 9 protein [Actinomadura spongiicola]RFS81604.1 chitin-binding protein [Actinomadura spongiicola]
MPANLRTPRKRTFAYAAVAAAGITMVTTAPALSHGYTTAPISRALFCQKGTARNCGEIQYEPSSVEGPKGFPQRGPRDGTICAGGVGRFKQLDDPRNGQWPTNKLTSGQSFTFTWRHAVPHATTSWHYYVTKDGWDPTKPLTRADLESKPLGTFSGGGRRPPSTLSHEVALPPKQGRHLLLAVWDIADTGNAFYQCSDVEFS